MYLETTKIAKDVLGFTLKKNENERYGKRIKVYGKLKEENKEKITEILKKCIGDEGKDRIFVREEVYKNNIEGINSILYNGNNILFIDKEIKLLKNFKKIIEKGVTYIEYPWEVILTKDFYNHCCLNFTIAHYDLNGWVSVYETAEDVCNLFLGTGERNQDTVVPINSDFANFKACHRELNNRLVKVAKIYKEKGQKAALTTITEEINKLKSKEVEEQFSLFDIAL